MYKIKRSAETGEAYRFKARMIMRGFEMEKGMDFNIILSIISYPQRA